MNQRQNQQGGGQSQRQDSQVRPGNAQHQQDVGQDDQDGAIPGSDQDTGDGPAIRPEQGGSNKRQQGDPSRTGSDSERS